ncbi:MAG: TrkA family potassium uptake protein [Chloroflexota bacterium]
MSQYSQQEFAIIGLGRFGYSLAVALEEHGHTVMAIDKDTKLVQSIVDQVTHAASLDSTQEDALKAIDIGAFDTAVVAIGNDFEANLLTTVNLKALGVRRVIANHKPTDSATFCAAAGADQVIQPEQNSAHRLAEELSTPAIIEHFNLGQGYSVAEIILPHPLAWKSMGQCDIRNKHHVNILLIKRGEEVLISPRADTILQKDDILIVFGEDQHISQFSNLK